MHLAQKESILILIYKRFFLMSGNKTLPSGKVKNSLKKGGTNMKKTLLAFFSVLILLISACGCGNTAAPSGSEIYFLNFKPEVEAVYQRIAEAYEQETGVKVKVVTAASGGYETTLKSEIAKSDAPTIFQINGPIAYETWKDYCLDLSGSRIYELLSDKSLAVTGEDGVYAIPYAMEGYGIIYNEEIMERYFDLPEKAVTIDSVEEIKNFELLKAVAEDMQKNIDKLGIKGVFASTSLSAGNQWRWQSHLANIPFYYEFIELQGYDSPIMAGLDAKTVEFKYAEQFKNIFDLYMNNSVSARGMLGAKTVNDAMAEFALGQCAMVQNGQWAAQEILGISGNTVEAEDIKFLPIYTGMSGEEKQGLCIGTENYLCINKNVSEEKQQASLDFLAWLFESETGKQFVIHDLGFNAPFTSFGENEKPIDPLSRSVAEWMDHEDVRQIPWVFTAFPSDEFKNRFGSALLEYAQGTRDWDSVIAAVRENWAEERIS